MTSLAHPEQALTKLPKHLIVQRRSRVVWIYASAFATMMFGPLLVPALSLGFLAGLLVFLVVVLGRLAPLMRKWGSIYTDADAHLRAYELDEAQALIESGAKQSRWLYSWHCLSVHMLAVIARMRGQIDNAEACVETVINSGWLDARRGQLGFHAPRVYGEKALLLALQGRLEEADQPLAHARSLLSPVRASVLALPSAVSRARREEWNECLARIDAERERFRGLLPPHDSRAIAVVEAFALLHVQSRAGYRAAAGARRIEDALADAKPAQPGEFAYLGHRWPAIREFVEAHFPTS